MPKLPCSVITSLIYGRSNPQHDRSLASNNTDQWVGIEIWKRLQYRREGTIHHLRTKDEAAVDFIVELGEEIIPIEVKWTEKPSLKNVPSLAYFLKENPRVKKGYVVCRCPLPAALNESITALPWQSL